MNSDLLEKLEHNGQILTKLKLLPFILREKKK
jgi:hypothetical protein